MDELLKKTKYYHGDTGMEPKDSILNLEEYLSKAPEDPEITISGGKTSQDQRGNVNDQSKPDSSKQKKENNQSDKSGKYITKFSLNCLLT